MGLLDRLAVIISGNDKGGVTALERTAGAADQAAIAEAKLIAVSDKLAVTEARIALAEAKGAGDAEAAAAATQTLTAAREKATASQLAFTRATQQASVAQAQKDLTGAEAALTGVTAKSGLASKALGAVGLSGLSSGAATATAAAAAAVAVEKVGEVGVHAYEGIVNQARQYQRSAGGTIEDASRQTAIFRGMGIGIDEASTAAFRLNKNIAENGDKLRGFGVEVERNADGTTNLNGTLLNIVKTYHATTDSAQRAALVQAAFGRGGQALLPILAASTDRLKELGAAAEARGEIVHPRDVEDTKKLSIAQRELGHDFKAIEAQLGQGLVPVLADLAAGEEKVVGTTASLLEKLNGKGSEIAKTFRAGLGFLTLGTSEVLIRLGESGKKAAEDVAPLADSLDDVTEAAAKDETAVSGLAGALDSYRSAGDKVTTTAKAVADSHQLVAKKAADQAKATADATKADADLKDAEDALHKAQRDAPLEIAKARDAEALATDDVKDKVLALKVATEEYGKGTIQATKAADELAASRDSAAEAARKAQDLAAQGNRPKTVQDAEEAIASAKERQAAAAQAKRDADAEDPVAEKAKLEREAATAASDELTSRIKLNDAIGAYNKQFGTTLTMADVLNGNLDKILAKQEQALLNAQKLAQDQAVAANQPFVSDSPTASGKAASRASAPGLTTERIPARQGDRENPFVQQFGDIIIQVPSQNPAEIVAAFDRRIMSTTRARVG